MKKDVTGAQRPQTKCVHASQELNRTSAISAPTWQTTTFRAELSEHFAELAKSVKPSEYYSRYGNPTHEQVEAVMAALEGGEAAMVTASGMGAIFTSVMSLLEREITSWRSEIYTRIRLRFWKTCCRDGGLNALLWIRQTLSAGLRRSGLTQN
jgi:cystathionine beta-lyase/cystathionine gamma-synthase